MVSPIRNEQTPRPPLAPTATPVHPCSNVVRMHVSVVHHPRSDLVPIRMTMTADGAPLSITYAHALYTLSDWCTHYIGLARSHPVDAERRTADLVEAILHDWARLYYDPATDWWVYVAENNVPSRPR